MKLSELKSIIREVLAEQSKYQKKSSITELSADKYMAASLAMLHGRDGGRREVRRQDELTRLFFNPFLRKELMGYEINDITATVKKLPGVDDDDMDPKAPRMFILHLISVHFGELATYDVMADKWAINRKINESDITSKDVKLLQSIAGKINPKSKYVRSSSDLPHKTR